MNYQFFKLDDAQMSEFLALKNAGKTSKHGPLNIDEKVSMHKHGEKAMYIVQGIAKFTGTMVEKVLGTNKKLNAVLVDANQDHGWMSKFKGTEIDQVHGETLVSKVLAAA